MIKKKILTVQWATGPSAATAGDKTIRKNPLDVGEISRLREEGRGGDEKKGRIVVAGGMEDEGEKKERMWGGEKMTEGMGKYWKLEERRTAEGKRSEWESRLAGRRKTSEGLVFLNHVCLLEFNS